MFQHKDKMMIRKFLEETMEIHDAAILHTLLAQFRFRTVPQGEQVLCMGQRSPTVPILWEGLCRGYTVQPDGKDVTDCFCHQRGCILLGTVPLGEPSDINIEALTDSTLLELRLEDLNHLMQYPAMNHAVQLCLFNALQLHRELKTILNQHTAEERYQWFLDNYPGLIDLVRKRHVASFLGLTPESLSRVRRYFLEPAGQAKQTVLKRA